MAKTFKDQDPYLRCYMTKVFRDLGLRQKDVAEKMGLKSQMSITLYKKNISVKILQQMADALGVHLIEFFTPMRHDDPRLVQFLKEQKNADYRQ